MKNLLVKIALLFAVIILHFSIMTGQDSRLNGRIMEGDTKRPVQFAHIQNFSTRQSVFSDTSGFFHIRANTGDTLVFSAIGYYYNMIVINDSLLNLAFFGTFRLTPRIYEIEEAHVYAFGTYEQFRQRFVNLDLSANKTEMLRRNLQQLALTEAREADRIAREKKILEEGAVMGSAPILTPEEKQMLKLKEILAGENRKNQVYQRYNPEIIKRITGMTCDEEIIEFMTFCNFSDDYILNINEYDLIVMIARKYEEFLRNKKTGAPDKNSQMPFNTVGSVFNEPC